MAGLQNPRTHNLNTFYTQPVLPYRGATTPSRLSLAWYSIAQTLACILVDQSGYLQQLKSRIELAISADTG
ncbi:hypothetical protein BCU66_011795 [Vibrio sp. 10N.286.49.B1]|uniref:hypothetical protein n=1 Tax=unclassified Vibrio TaxID=2614977 RepID=UPI001056A91D|nr:MULTISPECIES: hypothetical protein [unclassified Vibrio]